MGASEFEQVMVTLRPRLHRYCARMVGSAFDGEDVLQEALTKAAEALPQAGTIVQPENWLFRIAHNTALDALRRRQRRASMETDFAMLDEVPAPSEADARVAAAASLAVLLHLPVAQRATVVLVDVLGHSLTETASILDLTLAAVKASLHRARLRLRELADAPSDAAPPIAADERARLRAYADRFNARDFDALRMLLADDVRLDLVNRTRLAGRGNVEIYFTRYSELPTWRVRPGLAEGQPALLVSDMREEGVRFVVLLGWRDGQIATIRDFHYAPYVTDSLTLAPLSP